MKKLGKKLNNVMETVETYYKNCFAYCNCGEQQSNNYNITYKLSVIRDRRLNG